MEEISLKEYAEARATVDAFEKQRNAKCVDSYTCINCKEKEISSPHPEYINPLKQAQSSWDDGAVTEVAFGYGSRHDMENYYIAICDDCIDSLLESGLAVNKKDIHEKMKGCS